MSEDLPRLQDRLQRVLSKPRADNALADQVLAGAEPMRVKDNRKAPRRPSSLPAYLKIEGRKRMISCKVMDMSATGACLKVMSSDRLIKEDVETFPDHVTLYLTFDKVSIACEIAWRLVPEEQVGVRFLAPAQSYS